MGEQGERRREDKRQEEVQQLGQEAASGRQTGTAQLGAGSCCIHRSSPDITPSTMQERERESATAETREESCEIDSITNSICIPIHRNNDDDDDDDDSSTLG